MTRPSNWAKPRKFGQVFALAAVLMTVTVYNSCQKRLFTDGSFSAASLCNLDETTRLSPSQKPQLTATSTNSAINLFKRQKLQLGNLYESSTSTSKGGQQKQYGSIRAPRDLDLIVIMDNSCLESPQARANSKALEILANRNPHPDLVHQAYDFKVKAGENLDSLAEELQSDECVLGASLNHTYKLSTISLTASEPATIRQKHHDVIRTDIAYEFAQNHLGYTGASGDDVVVAVIDTGVDLGHPELKDQIYKYWVAGETLPRRGLDAQKLNYTGLFVDESDLEGTYQPWDEDPTPAGGHGTHVAGLIAAAKNNLGVLGVAPYKVKIMPIRVVDSTETASTMVIINAIYWAINEKVSDQRKRADVINYSLMNSENVPVEQLDDYGLRAAIEQAVSLGTLVVASMGNRKSGEENIEMDGNKLTVLPAYYASSIAGLVSVAAVDATDPTHLSSYSFWSPSHAEIAAPGSNNSYFSPTEGIYSTLPTYELQNQNGELVRVAQSPTETGYHYGDLHGTSMSAPMVSAAAAAIIGLHRFLYSTSPSPAETEAFLKISAQTHTELSAFVQSGRVLDLANLYKAVANKGDIQPCLQTYQ